LYSILKKQKEKSKKQTAKGNRKVIPQLRVSSFNQNVIPDESFL